MERKTYAGLSALVVILLLACGVYLYNYGQNRVNLCTDDSCFIEFANECKNVQMSKVIAGSIFEISSKNCVLTKTLLQIDPESPVLKGFLEGEYMLCPFSRGNLDTNLITSLSIGSENCQGYLKDYLLDLRETAEIADALNSSF